MYTIIRLSVYPSMPRTPGKAHSPMSVISPVDSTFFFSLKPLFGISARRFSSAAQPGSQRDGND